MIRRRSYLLGFILLLAFCASARAAEKVIYEKPSPYNTVVVTEDDQGLRTLMFERDGLRQSVVKVGDPDHIELPYPRAMFVALAVVERPKRVLIVGLGGGTIPSFLHKHYPQATIDVVDIDPEVVHAAKEYFGFREDATLHVHVDDGRRFIENGREPYDLIFLDAYGAENIPYHLATRQFLAAVRKALSPAGVVVANVFSRSSNALYDSMVRTYQEVFAELYILDVPGGGNKILLALSRPQRIQGRDLLQRARGVSKDKHIRFDLGDVVKYGSRREATTNTRGSVLMDKTATTTASTQPAQTPASTVSPSPARSPEP
jgi:spermidine synthase